MNTISLILSMHIKQLSLSQDDGVKLLLFSLVSFISSAFIISLLDKFKHKSPFFISFSVICLFLSLRLFLNLGRSSQSDDLSLKLLMLLAFLMFFCLETIYYFYIHE